MTLPSAWTGLLTANALCGSMGIVALAHGRVANAIHSFTPGVSPPVPRFSDGRTDGLHSGPYKTSMLFNHQTNQTHIYCGSVWNEHEDRQSVGSSPREAPPTFYSDQSEVLQGSYKGFMF